MNAECGKYRLNGGPDAATAADRLRLLEAVIVQSPAVVFYWEAETGWPIRYVSANARRWGLDPDALMARRTPYATLVLPEDLPELETQVAQLVAANASEYSLPYRLRLPDGRILWVEENGVILRDITGHVIGFHGIVLDVSLRREAERRLAEYNERLELLVAARTDELRQANEALKMETEKARQYEARWREVAARYEAIVEAFDGYIYICSPDLRIAFMNRRLIERIGREALGEPCHAILYDRDTACPWCVHERTARGEIVRMELPHPKDGRWYYVVSSPLPWPDGRVGMIAMVQDITERKMAELKARDSEKRYRELLGSVTDYVYTVEMRDGRPASTHHGPGCEAVTGYPPSAYAADPFLWLQMVYPEDRPSVLGHAQAILRGENPGPLEHRIIRKDGAVRWVRNTPSPRHDEQGVLIGYDGLVKDITEARLAQEQRVELERQAAEARQRAALERANRLASLGLLAAGIAHEINNPLQGMLSHLASVRSDLPPNFSRMKSLLMVERGIETIRGLVQRLLWLGAGHDETPHATLFSEAFNFVRELLQVALRQTNIRLEVELRTPDVTLPLSRGELSQVLLNLLTNARDAMPEGGTITVTAERTDGHVLISVADTGTGIPEEIQGRIFTPFCTTKGVRGTGLGLSIVHSIVRAHGGEISFETSPGKGTVFRIQLPIAEERQ